MMTKRITWGDGRGQTKAIGTSKGDGESFRQRTPPWLASSRCDTMASASFGLKLPYFIPLTSSYNSDRLQRGCTVAYMLPPAYPHRPTCSTSELASSQMVAMMVRMTTLPLPWLRNHWRNQIARQEMLMHQLCLLLHHHCRHQHRRDGKPILSWKMTGGTIS